RFANSSDDAAKDGTKFLAYLSESRRFSTDQAGISTISTDQSTTSTEDPQEFHRPIHRGSLKTPLGHADYLGQQGPGAIRMPQSCPGEARRFYTSLFYRQEGGFSTRPSAFFFRQTLLGLSTGLEKCFSPLSERGSWSFRAGVGQ